MTGGQTRGAEPDRDRPSAGPPDLEGLDLDLPDLALPDFAAPSEAAIRRAVVRGVVRSGFAAAAWLVLASVLAAIAWAGAGALRGQQFGHLALHGIEVAHPEYAVTQRTYRNFGATTMTLELRARGELDAPAPITGRARQPVIGDLELDLGAPSDTPVRRALSRGPASPAGVLAYLGNLPATVSASAVVEFATPLRPADLATFAGSVGANRDAPTATAGLSAAFLSAPYGPEPTVSWPSAFDLDGYAQWARKLRPGDDGFLAKLDLPPSAKLREIAQDLRIRAVVVDRIPVKALQTMLADPTVQSVNIVDVGFDVDAQLPR